MFVAAGMLLLNSHLLLDMSLADTTESFRVKHARRHARSKTKHLYSLDPLVDGNNHIVPMQDMSFRGAALREGDQKTLTDLASTSRFTGKPVVDLDADTTENAIDFSTGEQDWDSFVQLYMMSYPENIDDLVKYREYNQRISREDLSWSPPNSKNMKVFSIVCILAALPADYELLALKELVSTSIHP